MATMQLVVKTKTCIRKVLRSNPASAVLLLLLFFWFFFFFFLFFSFFFCVCVANCFRFLFSSIKTILMNSYLYVDKKFIRICY